MQYIDFTENILQPSSETEVGFKNGFSLSSFDPNVAGYDESQFPEGFPLTNLSSRFLSLLAYDPINSGNEYINIYQTEDEAKNVFVLWTRSRQPQVEGENPIEKMLNSIKEGPDEKTIVLNIDSVENAMNFCVEKLVSMGYEYDIKEAVWERKAVTYE